MLTGITTMLTALLSTDPGDLHPACHRRPKAGGPPPILMALDGIPVVSLKNVTEGVEILGVFLSADFLHNSVIKC